MKSRILITEDDSAIGKLLCFTLVRADFEVVIANNEHTLREQLKHFSPHLMLLDVILGSKNGVALYEELLAEGLDPKIPVLFLSATVSRLASLTGPSGKHYTVLPKPFEVEDLIGFLRSAIAKSEKASDSENRVA
jgi:DNA-binding response OmpR family regulator